MMKMQPTKKWLGVLVALAVAGVILPTPPSAFAAPTASELQNAVSDVAKIGESRTGTKGATLFLLEEAHNSRLQQLQHAIVMATLHERYGLKDIALEGYLIDQPTLDLREYRKMFSGLSAEDRAKIAVQFLKEGEISGAEFMSLVYDDIKLYPVELKAQHDVGLSESASKGVEAYLQAIARIDLSWAKAKADQLNDSKRIMSLSIMEQCEEYKAIKKYAEDRHVFVGDNEQRGMNEYILFLEGRAKADPTMFGAASKIADTQGVSILAMNIGALHTKAQVAQCKAAGRPFVVVTPLAQARDITKSDLTTSMYERKLKQRSVFSSGLSLTIEKLVGAKKPGPVLGIPWNEIKTELYTFTARGATAALKPKPWVQRWTALRA